MANVLYPHTGTASTASLKDLEFGPKMLCCTGSSGHKIVGISWTLRCSPSPTSRPGKANLQVPRTARKMLRPKIEGLRELNALGGKSGFTTVARLPAKSRNRLATWGRSQTADTLSTVEKVSAPNHRERLTRQALRRRLRSRGWRNHPSTHKTNTLTGCSAAMFDPSFGNPFTEQPPVATTGWPKRNDKQVGLPHRPSGTIEGHR